MTFLNIHIFFVDFYFFRFKIDENYIGEPPALEITINNLNDNIDKGFLSKMITDLGEFDELNVYYHPGNHRHLGLARIVFQSVRSATLCIEKFNGKSVMGKVNPEIIMISFFCD